MAANFKLYRDLNVLYDTFSGLVESAGAFGPAEQYSPLAADIVRLDQLRHQCAERLDQMTEASDAEVIRLRSQLAAATARAAARTAPPARIVVDDNHPHSAAHPPARKKKKTPNEPDASAQTLRVEIPAPYSIEDGRISVVSFGGQTKYLLPLLAALTLARNGERL